MLDSCAVMTFVGTRDAARALAFYRDRLGLRFVADDSFALVFDAHGTMLRISRAGPFTPLPFTALGWVVSDIHGQVRELAARGVEFERYAHVPADDLGVWAAPDDGTKVAWFKDPDGNTLSLTEFGALSWRGQDDSAAQSLRMRRLWPFLLLASIAHADAGDALRRDDVTDELALAQIADEAGDGALGTAIAAQGARGQALVAARAAVHGAAPELLVPALVELALSRDPALAAEAAESVTAIFDRLTPSELGAREVLLADLRTACTAFEKLSSASAPRADIAAALTQAGTCCQLLLKQP